MALPLVPLLLKGWGFLRDPKTMIILVVIAVVAYSAKATVDNIQDTAYAAGRAAEKEVWEERIKLEKEAYDKEVSRLSELVDTTKKDLEEELARIEQDAATRIQGVIDEKNATIANLRNGNLRLSIELRNTAAEAATTELAGATAVRNATYRAELSEAASEFLISYAADADIAAERLGVCQETIRTYRSKVEEYNKKYATYSF